MATRASDSMGFPLRVQGLEITVPSSLGLISRSMDEILEDEGDMSLSSPLLGFQHLVAIEPLSGLIRA